MKIAVTCPCGKKIEVKKSQLGRKKYCSKPCFYNYRIRPTGLFYVIKKKNPTSFRKGHISWNNGKKLPFPIWNKGKGIGYINYQGYKIVCINGKEFLEHRLIMENYLNRKLNSSDIIHHIDGNRLNNSLENLELLNRSSHSILHNTLRKCVFV